MPKTASTNGKEKESHWIEERLTANEQERTEVRERIAKLKPHIEHVEEEPEISDEARSLGVHSPQQQASAVITDGPTIILPLTSSQIKIGLHHKIYDAIRWLAVWCIKVASQARARGLSVIFGAGWPVTDKEILEDEKEAGILDAGRKSS